MKKKYKKTMYPSVSLILISFILWNQFLIFGVNANTDFNTALELGTQIYEVKKYDEVKWKSYIDENLSPSDWFGNNADKLGAKSRLTTLERTCGNLSMYYTFIRLNIIPQDKLQLFYNLSYYGYDRDYIMANYTSNYRLCSCEYLYWTFTLGEFDETMEKEIERMHFVLNPQDFKSLVDDYNNFSTIINNDPVLQSLNWSLPLLTGDDFLWQFILTRRVISSPFNEYLITLIDALECGNASVHDSTLVLQRHGINNYSVEIGYNIQGMIDNIVIKNFENSVIYEITSYTPKVIFFIILGIVVSFIAGGVILIIIRKRKKMKLFLKSLNNS